MFNFNTVNSNKAQFGAIWVAAYFFRKLKKAQVNDTHIPSTVDGILQNEWNAVAYRMLAYLLLGVVRIYAKKVDYLFRECNKFLLRVGDYMVKEKRRAQKLPLSISSGSIILPKRFELDAFDLGIAEDSSRECIKRYEDITLRDEALNDDGTGHWISERFDVEQFEGFHEALSADDDRTVSVHYCQEMGISTEIKTSSCQDLMVIDMEGQEDMHEANITMEPQNEPPNLNQSPEKDPQNIIKHNQDSKLGRMQRASRTWLQGGDMLHLKVCGANKLQMADDESLTHGILDIRNDQTVGGGQISDMSQMEPSNLICDILTGETNNEKHLNDRISDANRTTEDKLSVEKLRSNRFSDTGKKTFEVFARLEEADLGTYDKGVSPGSVLEMTSLRCNKYLSCAVPTPITPDVISPLSIPIDPGTSTAQFEISTPVTKESTRALRKRCLIDESIVFSNSYMKSCLEDSSGLISKRRKVPQTSFAAWKEQRLSRHSQCLFDPLISYNSLEFQSMFFLNETKLLETHEPSESSKLSGTIGNFGGTKQSELAETIRKTPKATEPLEVAVIVPQTSVAYGPLEQAVMPPETFVISKHLELTEIVLDTFSTSEPLEQAGIAPETPVRKSASIRSLRKSKMSCMDETRVLNFSGSCERVIWPVEAHNFELNLIQRAEGGEWQTNGFSRTRSALMEFLKEAVDQSNRDDEMTLNMLELCDGRTRTENAKLFYEILVLKTKGCLDVKQADPFGEILIRHACQ